MATVLNRTTTELRQSVNTANFSDTDWIINPDLSNVYGTPTKYWIITGDVVTLMTAPQMAVVDATEAAAEILSHREGASTEPDEVDDYENVRVRGLIELLNKRDNYLTNRIIELQERVQAMLDSSGNLSNMKAAGSAINISATNTRGYQAAVTDYQEDINAGNQDTF